MKQTEHDEIKLRIGDMLFTWDDEKERINIRKHKIDFRAAASVSIDSYIYIESNSVDECTGEERLDA
ncbi:MAG: BrnT family toxin, partial [Synergistaceae bacterium]|nr:BrnT family toxin [Synergistaceae bacterium]